jgi:hypothetical protein
VEGGGSVNDNVGFLGKSKVSLHSSFFPIVWLRLLQASQKPCLMISVSN